VLTQSWDDKDLVNQSRIVLVRETARFASMDPLIGPMMTPFVVSRP
jgi:hypothetical protein